MNYLILILNIFIILNISGLEIEICENEDKFICDMWKTEKSNEYSLLSSKKTHEASQRQGGLFLLLENNNIYDVERNEFCAFCYKDSNNKKIKSEIKGIYNGISFKVDFSGDSPKYKLKIEKKEVDDSCIVTTKDLYLENDDDLKEAVKSLVSHPEKYDDKQMGKIKNLIKELVNGFEEKNKKWALFKIKLKDEDDYKYFYCNDIESIEDKCGMFAKQVEEIEIIKSNCADIVFLSKFTAGCECLIKIDLSNLITINPIDISSMFLNCIKLEEVIFPKNLRVNNIHLSLHKSCNEVKINLEDLIIVDLELKDFSCSDSEKKIKLPNLKIKKDSKVCIDKNSLSTDEDKEKGILKNNNLEEIDLSNVEFEVGAGENMFKNITIGKIILSVNMKNLSEQQLKNIFKDCKISIIVIGVYELKVEEYDKIELFIKDPAIYLKDRENIKNSYKKHIISKITVSIKTNNNNQDGDKKDVNRGKCCLCIMRCYRIKF